MIVRKTNDCAFGNGYLLPIFHLHQSYYSFRQSVPFKCSMANNSHFALYLPQHIAILKGILCVCVKRILSQPLSIIDQTQPFKFRTNPFTMAFSLLAYRSYNSWQILVLLCFRSIVSIRHPIWLISQLFNELTNQGIKLNEMFIWIWSVTLHASVWHRNPHLLISVLVLSFRSLSFYISLLTHSLTLSHFVWLYWKLYDVHKMTHHSMVTLSGMAHWQQTRQHRNI